MTSKRTVILFAMLLLLTLFVGCEKGPEGPQGPAGHPGPSLIYVIGGVQTIRSWYWYPTPYAYVWVSNIPEVPKVTINNIPILHQGGLNFINYNFPISPGDSANLLVTYRKLDGDSGTAQAKIRLAGQFEITSQDTSSFVTIPVGNGLSVTWSPSNGADVYSVYFYLYYYYYDTLGNYRYFYNRSDTLFTGTSITYPPSKLFPNLGEIDSISYSYGYFYVYAVEGPWQEGADGNVTGDGMGFFYGWTFGGWLDIDVSGSVYLAGKGEEPRNHFQEFLEKRRRALNLY